MTNKNESRRLGIIIPVHKAVPNETEVYSLKQCFTILHSYTFFLACPETFNEKEYLQIANDYKINLHICKFEDHYFNGIEGYNRLLLSTNFYSTFKECDFILIYQLDALIFRNELETWMDKNYDYVGSPWINHEWLDVWKQSLMTRSLKESGLFKKIILKLKWKLKNYNDPMALAVGNGGLSLRKTSSFIKILNKMRYHKLNEFNEDVFWSIYMPLNYSFKVASFKEALKFSFDVNPELAFEFLNGELPMGCHGWNRSDNLYHNNSKFWNKILNITV